MLSFLRNHWILLFSLLLLVLMVIPLLYFGTLFGMLDHRRGSQASSIVNSRPVLGICLDNMLESHSMLEKEVFQNEADQGRVPVVIRVAHHSLERQIDQVRSLIRTGVKGLILVPVKRTGLVGVLQEAAAAGVKIILFGELTEGPVDLYCGLDYREMGRIQAAYLCQKAGPGLYLILKGPAHSYQAGRIMMGQVEVLQKMFSHGIRFRTLEVQPQWTPEATALKIRTEALHEKLDAILTPNDIYAEEIGKLFTKQGLPVPFLGGIGGERRALYRIIAKEQLITVAADYEGLAQKAFHSAVALSSGKSVTFETFVTYNSKKIPAIIEPVYPITPVNVEAFLKKRD